MNSNQSEPGSINGFWGTQKSVGLLLLLHGAIWLFVSAMFDIHPDMADHWVWSRYLTWGYFEHPPFVALTMAFATFIGDPIWGLKIGSVLFSMVILWAAFEVAKSMVGRKGAWWFLVFLESTPYFTLGSTFWHIDQPYMLFWLAGLGILARLVRTEDPRWMLAFGVVLGLGAESKYIMALLPLGFALFMAFNRRWLFLLKSPYTWAGALICFALLGPNLYWNATHQWVTFSYNFKKGLTGGDPLRHFSLFTLGHLLLFSLILAPAVWLRLFRVLPGWMKHRDCGTLNEGWPQGMFSMVLCTAIVPVAFFTAASFKGRGADPHWLNVGYFGLLLILAQDWSRRLKNSKLLVIALGFNYILVGSAVTVLFFNPFGYEYTDTRAAKTLGWAQSSQEVLQILDQAQIEAPQYVISREYHLSGAFSLYLPNHPWPHSLEKPIRNQWSPVKDILKQGAIVVCPPKECSALFEAVKLRFHQEPKYLGLVNTEVNGFAIRRLSLFYLQPVTQ